MELTLDAYASYYGSLGGNAAVTMGVGIHDSNNEELVEAGVSNWGEHAVLMETGIFDPKNKDLVKAGKVEGGHTTAALKKEAMELRDAGKLEDMTEMHNNLLDAQQNGAMAKSIQTFEERLPGIVSYHEMHGHTRVSRDDTDFPGVGSYLCGLRGDYRKHMKKMEEGSPDKICLQWDQIWKDRHAKLAKLDFDWNPVSRVPTEDWSTLSFVTLTRGRSRQQLCDYLEAKGEEITYANGEEMTKADLAKAIKGQD